jgi:hypothetical protein
LDKIPSFGRRKYMTAAQALAAGVSIDDLLWVAGRMGLKEQCVRFALACARRVAYLNYDPCVQAALDATQAWLDSPAPETSEAAARAAWVAAEAAAEAAAEVAWAWAWEGAEAWEAEAAGTKEIAEQRRIFLEIFG